MQKSKDIAFGGGLNASSMESRTLHEGGEAEGKGSHLPCTKSASNSRNIGECSYQKVLRLGKKQEVTGTKPTLSDFSNLWHRDRLLVRADRIKTITSGVITMQLNITVISKIEAKNVNMDL